MTDIGATSGTPVDLRGLRKQYGGVEVLHGIDIAVPAGSFTTFLGPSGSGKTTTLAITTGLIKPDAGRVEIGGRDCTRLPVHRREIGFVFQSYALFPHMSVERNVGFPLKLRHVSRAEMHRRVGEALELVRLSSYRKHFPSQLSGGQQQRVALARAVVFHPRVLLMDEPLGALDAGLRVHLQREIVRIGRELGVTVIYVTHDQAEALTMSDQVVLFKDGNIEQAGTPQELYGAPRTEFAARFMANAPLLPGTLESSAHGILIRHAAGATPVSAESVQAQGLSSGAPCAAVLRSEYLDPVPDRDGSGDTAVSRLLIGRGTVADVIYAGARERLSITLDNGVELDYYYDSIDGLAWHRGDRLAVSVRPDKLPPVVPRDTASQADAPAAEATADGPPETGERSRVQAHSR
ncbi:MAG TPA: ABC transporter ATP-binding protein [Streptosporangiaceae bacterium]|nr:ABC transporter ATP-binding protein [Streptosporangiaceae bacterium]